MKEKELERLTKLKEIEKDLYEKGFKNICESFNFGYVFIEVDEWNSYRD